MAGTYTPVIGDWRWFADNNVEPVDGDGLAIENNKPTLPDNNSIIRLRVEVVETGGANSTASAWYLQFSLNGVDGWTSLGPTQDWDYANGQATEGNSVAGALVADASLDGGVYRESGSYATQLGKNDVNEEDFAIVPVSGQIIEGQDYYFRLFAAGTEAPPSATYGPNTLPQVHTAAGVEPPLTIDVSDSLGNSEALD